MALTKDADGIGAAELALASSSQPCDFALLPQHYQAVFGVENALVSIEAPLRLIAAGVLLRGRSRAIRY
ncbi:hypothetical protein [Propionivibrio sp.]|uniref:hypothetical protein n=1 Tax=Propionivibrio sp. TaxID=2212460 RepID=UPI0025D6E2E9|nr:hypothetical protein [Propionivibrio sp.]